MKTLSVEKQHSKDAGRDTIFGPLELYRISLRRWKMIAGTVFLGVGLAMLGVFMQTPLYTSTTEIIIDPRSKAITGEQDVLSGLGTDTAAIGSQVRIIKSASVAKRVIKKLNLHKDPEFNSPPVKPWALLLKLWAQVNGEEFKLEPEISFNEDRSEKQLQSIIEAFSRKVKTHRIGKTYVIAISFTSKDAKKAARIANQIADSYLVNQLVGKFEFNRRAKLWLRDRLEDLQEKVEDSEKAVELYKTRHNLIGSKGKMPYEVELDGLNEKLILARVDLSERHTQYQQINDVLRSRGRLSSVGALAASDEIKKLRIDRARLAQEEAELITKFTKRHPKVISKRNERRDLEQQIEREAGKVVDNIKSEYQASKSKVVAIEKSLYNLQKKTQLKRAAQIKLRELQREANADRAVYNSFLERFKQTSQQEKSRAADIRVIETAVAARTPSSPNKRRAVLLSFVGFLALGLGFAVLVELTDTSFKTPEDVEEVLNTSLLASVPKLSSSDFYHEGQKIPLDRFAIMKPLTLFAESMRTLKVCLELSGLDETPQVILITSVIPNEGKTSICANLAQHAANVGARTLLIDTDLRNPSLSARLGSGGRGGLIDLLSQRVRREDIIVCDHTGVDILPGQSVPYNSAEILGSESMKSLLSELRKEYDFIILDTSPVMPVIDAKVLIESVDRVVLVLEWDRTSKEAAKNALNRLEPLGKKMAGVVFNKVNMKRMRGYGVYGYGEYYQKGSYYGAGN